MDCREIKNKLSGYIDGILDAKDRELLKEHLECCADCRQEYGDITKIIGYMQGMESPEPSPAFLQNVKARLDKSSAFKSLLKRLFFPLHIKIPLELTGMAVVLILVIYISGIISGPQVYDLSFAFKAPAISDSQEKKGEKGEKGEKREKKGERSQGEQRELSLKEIIASKGGRIVESEYDEKTSTLKSMTIEIPADALNQLILDLQELGQFKGSFPNIKQLGKKTIKVRIKLENL